LDYGFVNATTSWNSVTEETFLQDELALCFEPRLAKFQRSSAKGTFSNWGLKWKG